MTARNASRSWAVAVWGCVLATASLPRADDAPAGTAASAMPTLLAIDNVDKDDIDNVDIGGGDGAADGAAGSGRLAVTGNGQTIACIAPDRSLVACDRVAADSHRVIVAAPEAATPVPLALGFIDSSVVAAVCRAGDDWSLRSWRLLPDGPAEPSAPLQTVRLGRAAGAGSDVRLAVSRAREWLVVTGLPPPLAPVLRAAIAGVRMGPLSDRHCPKLESGIRPVAVTAGPLEQLVLVERRADGPAAGDGVSFHDAAGHCLLRLDTGLPSIRDVAFTPDSGNLMVVAGRPGSEPDGLWRLDAALRDRRQAITAVPVAPLPGAVAVACPTDDDVLVAQSGPRGLRVVRVPVPRGDAP